MAGRRRKTEIELRAKDQASTVYKKVRGESEGLERATKRLKTSYMGLGQTVKRFLPFIGGAAILAGIRSMIMETARAGDQYAKMSQKIGVSVETLSTFDHVAKLSGITLDIVSVGLRRFAQNAVDMSRGIGEAKREFEELGIETMDAEGNIREMEDLLLDVADSFSRMDDGTKKTATAMRLFGRSGSEMIPMLNKGRQGLRAMMDEARDLGLVFSEESAKAMEDFNDNLTRLKGSLTGLVRYIMGPVIGALNRFFELIGMVPEMQKLQEEIYRTQQEMKRLEREMETGARSAHTRRGTVRQEISDLEEKEKKYEGLAARLVEMRERLKQLKPATDELGEGLNRLGESVGMAATGITRVADGLTLEAWYEATQNAALFGEKLDDIMGKAEAVKMSMEGWDYGAWIEATDNAVLFGEGMEKAAERTEYAGTAANRLGDGLVDVALEGQKAGQVLHGMMISFIRDLVQATIKALILKTVMGSIGGWVPLPFKEGGMIPSAQHGMARVPREMLIRAHPEEAVLNKEGVRAIGGPGMVAAINRGDVSIVMTNNFGGINNIMDVEEMGALMGRQIVTEIREA